MGCRSSKPAPLEHGKTLLTSSQAAMKGLVSPVPILARLRTHAEAGLERAVVETGAKVPSVTISYAALLRAVDSFSKVVAECLAGRPEGLPRHVAFLVNPSIAYVVTELSIWAAGGVCVPLSVHSPAPELEYFMEDSQAALAIADAASQMKLSPVAEKLGRPFATITGSRE